MSNLFTPTQNALGKLRLNLLLAEAFDMIEIHMSAILTSGTMGVPMAAVLEATCLPRVHAARARSEEAMRRIDAVVRWLSASEDSPRRMGEAIHSWESLGRRAEALGEEMKGLQKRGLDNDWSGEAKAEWTRFTCEQIDRHSRFQVAVGEMPGQLESAKAATERLLVQSDVVTTKAAITTMTASVVPPAPVSFNLAIGMRTTIVAARLDEAAVGMEALRGGDWRLHSNTISASMYRVGDRVAQAADGPSGDEGP